MVDGSGEFACAKTGLFSRLNRTSKVMHPIVTRTSAIDRHKRNRIILSSQIELSHKRGELQNGLAVFRISSFRIYGSGFGGDSGRSARMPVRIKAVADSIHCSIESELTY